MNTIRKKNTDGKLINISTVKKEFAFSELLGYVFLMFYFIDILDVDL